MSAPTPAQPSEGAMFMWGPDVPVGWEFRTTRDNSWRERSNEKHLSTYDQLVEARPKPEPLVAVMLPKSSVMELAGQVGWWSSKPLVDVVTGCREALEALESDS